MCSVGDSNVVSLLRLSLENKENCRVKAMKHVRFSNVEIREYALVVGDHPYCLDGLALSLDWSYSINTTVKNVVENVKSSGRPRRLDYFQRRLRLQQASSDRHEMKRFFENEWIRNSM